MKGKGEKKVRKKEDIVNKKKLYEDSFVLLNNYFWCLGGQN